MTPEQFMEGFGVVAEVPERGIKKLRELIVESAITGRFDESDPADEGPEAIIGAATEGWKNRTKRRLDLAPQEPEDTGLYGPLPSHWRLVSLDLVSTVVRGVTFPGADKSRIQHDGFVPVLRSGNLQRVVAWGDLLYIPKARVKNPGQWLRHQDILISVANSYDLVGKSARLVEPKPPKVTLGGFLAVVRTDYLVPEFLALVLGSDRMTERFRRGSSQTTNIANISLQLLRSSPIPVPPLAEQHRIVAKVDQLMSMLDDLEQRQEKKRTAAIHVSKASLDRLVNAGDADQLARAWERVSRNFGLVTIGDATSDLSDLKHALARLGLSGRLTRRRQSDGRVSDLLGSVAKTRRLRLEASNKRAPAGHPVTIDSDGLPTIPEEWCWTSLEYLAEHIVDGTHHTPTYVEDGVCFISATNIRNRRVIFDGCRRITEAQYQELVRRCAPKRGDVLITKSGTLGKVAVVDDDRRFTLFESVALVPVLPPISSEYIAYCAEVACAGEFGKTTERGVAVKHLHLRDLRRMPIPLPPVDEQERIVAVLGRLMALVDCLRERIAARDSCSRRIAGAGLGAI